MPYQLAILQLSGFNATGAKWSQQDAIGYVANGVTPTLLQQDDLLKVLDLPSPDVLLLVADGVSASPAAASASHTVVNYLLRHWSGAGFPASNFGWHSNIWPIRLAVNGKALVRQLP